MATGQRPRVAVVGGGSAAEQFCRSVAGRADVIVYEPALVGGECPFLACMPSKSMLHVARDGGGWDDAVRHREEVVSGRDDHQHERDLVDLGVDLRRARARIVGPGLVEDDDGGGTERVDHLVIATGADAPLPPIDGIDADEVAPLVWTSDDVYQAFERPERVVVLGGGVIGFELAELFLRVGTQVTVVERSARSFEEFPPEVIEVVTTSLVERGADVRHGREVSSVRAAVDGLLIDLDDGSTLGADRLIVATGKQPRTTGFGLERLGIDESAPMSVDRTGRVAADGSVWAIGDVAGWGEYTHLANHQAIVVADQLFGSRQRTFDDVAPAACMFTEPPLISVGDSWASIRHDDDVVDVELDLATFPRAITDRLGPGRLWVAARRSTGIVVAAAGAGPSFDELVHALVIAVDGAVPVARLRCSMQPFPTIGEILGPIWDRLHGELTGS